MKSEIFLDEAEIVRMTKRVRHSAQLRRLRALGIEPKVCADGSLLVLHSQVDKAFNINESTARKKTAQPNWDAL